MERISAYPGNARSWRTLVHVYGGISTIFRRTVRFNVARAELVWPQYERWEAAKLSVSGTILSLDSCSQSGPPPSAFGVS